MVCTLSALREIQFGAGIFKIPRRINAFRGGRASGGSERAAIHGEQEIAKPVAAVLAFGRVRGFGKGRNRLRRLVARTPLEYQLPETELYAGLCFGTATAARMPRMTKTEMISIRVKPDLRFDAAMRILLIKGCEGESREKTPPPQP